MELMDILEYITYTPNNTNPAILKEMLAEYGAEDTFDEVWEYIGKNVGSLNLSVLAPIIINGATPTPSEDGSKVGTMIVGSGTVGEDPNSK